jgi:hypothetical protein
VDEIIADHLRFVFRQRQPGQQNRRAEVIIRVTEGFFEPV